MDEVAKDAPNGFRNLKCSTTSNDLRLVPFAGCEDAKVYEDDELVCTGANVKDATALERKWSIALRKCSNDFQELNPHTATSQYSGRLVVPGHGAVSCGPGGDEALHEVIFNCLFDGTAKPKGATVDAGVSQGEASP